MDSKTCFSLLLAVMLPLSLASPAFMQVRRPSIQSVRLERVTSGPKVSADLCPLCIQFTDQALNALLNIILNGGVVGTCGTLCNALAQKTGSQVLGEVCTILCDIVGVEEFIKIIDKADLDPIYFCEILKTCAIFDGGDAQITNVTITPNSGPQGYPEQVKFSSPWTKGRFVTVTDYSTVELVPSHTSVESRKSYKEAYQVIKCQTWPYSDSSHTSLGCSRTFLHLGHNATYKTLPWYSEIRIDFFGLNIKIKSERNIDIEYMSKNGTGTGELIVLIRTVDGIPVDTSILQERQPAGNYSKQLTLKAEPDPDCDPTQGPCEMWVPGNYVLAVELCNGECGSSHPHSQVYDKKETPFVITEN